jgi:hypothetical protein
MSNASLTHSNTSLQLLLLHASPGAALQHMASDQFTPINLLLY